MAFDLRAALLKKGEVESARLDDFAFRERARTMRLIAAVSGEDADSLVRKIAVSDDAAILSELVERHGCEAVDAAHLAARAEARSQLFDELGDRRRTASPRVRGRQKSGSTIAVTTPTATLTGSRPPP